MDAGAEREVVVVRALAPRWMSNRSGSVNRAGSRLAAAGQAITCCPRRMWQRARAAAIWELSALWVHTSSASGIGLTIVPCNCATAPVARRRVAANRSSAGDAVVGQPADGLQRLRHRPGVAVGVAEVPQALCVEELVQG